MEEEGREEEYQMSAALPKRTTGSSINEVPCQSDEDSLSYSESRNDSDELRGMKWRRRDERKNSK